MRVERDPEAWRPIFALPEVSGPTLHGEPFERLRPLFEEPHLPLFFDRGGFLMRNMDGFGAVWELHAAFAPEMWGPSVAKDGKSLVRRMFEGGAQMLLVTEQLAHWRSRPPKSYGWRQTGVPFASPYGEVRLWFLTPQAWSASPAFKRMI